MKRFTTIALAATLFHQISAQITPIGTVGGSTTWPPRLLRSLPSAGPKILEILPTGIELYNLDLTPYRSVTYPSPPPGFQWHWEFISFVTEDVFDQDPSTIEILMTMNEIGWNGIISTAVVSENGNIVFQAPYEAPTGMSGASEFTSSPSVFNTPNGAVLALQDSLNVLHLYQLPGMLPCIECDGSITSGIAMGGMQGDPTPSGMSLYPNPSADRAEVIFGLPAGTTARNLVLLDMAGHVIKRLPVPAGADRMTITTADVSTGTYSFQLETNKGTVQGKRLVVVR